MKQPSTIPEYSDLEIEYWVQVGNKKVLNVGGGRLVTIGRGRIGEESRNHGGVEQDDVSLGGRGRGGGQSLRGRGSGISGGRAKIANCEQSHNFNENDIQNNNQNSQSATRNRSESANRNGIQSRGRSQGGNGACVSRRRIGSSFKRFTLFEGESSFQKLSHP